MFWDDDAILRQKQKAGSHPWAELHDPSVMLCGQKSNCFWLDMCMVLITFEKPSFDDKKLAHSFSS